MNGFNIQFSYVSFNTDLLSPVRALSSILIPLDSITNKSAGMTSPREMHIISPTSKSSDFIFTFDLFRIVLKKTVVFFKLFNSKNFFSFCQLVKDSTDTTTITANRTLAPSNHPVFF